MMAFVKALLAALGACAAAAPLRAPTDKPNVVLIYADDLGFGDPGFNGHPTNDSPHIDGLRARGKRITTWYSGCPVCTGSRASLMTGRVFSRVGVPGVFGGTSQTGLPLSEVTLADQFKKAGYATGAVGKWHLGQREMYLPAARGFDEYLGIPFSDDMGAGRYSPCGKGGERGERGAAAAAVDAASASARVFAAAAAPWQRHAAPWEAYVAHGYTQDAAREADADGDDQAGNFLPLVAQQRGASRAEADDGASVATSVVEQPLDFTTLAAKYASFATGYAGGSGMKLRPSLSGTRASRPTT